jgi:4-hydroxythreonine-4-phosphate dehydrogenase
VRAACRPVVVGDRAVLVAAAAVVGADARAIADVAMVELGLCDERDFATGRVDARHGEASFRYLEHATGLVQAGEADALVTGPINKAAWHLAGRNYPGQTEVLAQMTGCDDYAMMLASGAIRSILVTTHIALAQVPSAITRDRVEARIRLANRAVAAFVGRQPRIAVAGLNPHAGEGGLFGTEDRDVIEPAVASCRADGIDVDGPLPSDTVYLRALNGTYDVVVAMYHDQGLIPVKLNGFERGINVTLGLPIVRTSPDHGTAFDIAGRGVATATSMIEAVLAAVRLTPHAAGGGKDASTARAARAAQRPLREE